jgi:hypothetical protein
MQVRRLTIIVATAVLLAAGCGTDTAVVGSSIAAVPSDPPATQPATPESSTAPTTPAPTPPELAVTDPRPGSVVTSRAFRFVGTVEPGVELTAGGGDPVQVAADGTWSTVLLLDPGPNLVRFLAANEGGPACVELAVHYEPPIELRGDGLGVVDFGRPTEEALDVLEATLGPPSRSDEGFYRYWHWDRLGLTVAFDAGSFYRGDAVEHFMAWSVWGEPAVALLTSEGIGLGDDHAALVAAHGEHVSDPVAHDECMPPWYVWLNDPGSDMTQRILVAFEVAPNEDGAITYLHAGGGEGC